LLIVGIPGYATWKNIWRQIDRRLLQRCHIPWERGSGPNKIASTGSRKHDKVVNCDVNLVQEEEEEEEEEDWCTVY
jgi:hypothetical protein